jgi:hypothetical protein
MNDLLDEFGPEEEDPFEMDIFAEGPTSNPAGDNCGGCGGCQKKKGA